MTLKAGSTNPGSHLLAFLGLWLTASLAHASCGIGAGTEDLTIDNPSGGISAGAFNDCWAPSSIQVSATAFPDRSITHLIAPRVALKAGTSVRSGGRLHVYTRFRRFNDTGVTRCLDANGDMVSCPVSAFPKQDGEQGRDRQYPDDSDGHAGFRFTPLDADGNPVAGAALGWRCIRDEVTGLIWEIKTSDGGLHDRGDFFSWYASGMGFPDEFSSCHGYDPADPLTYCNTEAFVRRVNREGLCGASNWRLPRLEELLGIVDFSVAPPGPTIDENFFTGATNEYYWTATADWQMGAVAWVVFFRNGGHGAHSGDLGYPVRLVRDGP